VIRLLALVYYAMAASTGVEVANFNLAYLCEGNYVSQTTMWLMVAKPTSLPIIWLYLPVGARMYSHLYTVIWSHVGLPLPKVASWGQFTCFFRAHGRD